MAENKELEELTRRRDELLSGRSSCKSPAPSVRSRASSAAPSISRASSTAGLEELDEDDADGEVKAGLASVDTFAFLAGACGS